MKVGLLGDGQELGQHDLDVVGADARRDHRDAQAPVPAGDRAELAMLAIDLDVVEQRGDALGPVQVAGQQDVVGHLAGGEVDVVLALGVGQRDQRVRVGHVASFSSTSASARAARNDSHHRARAASRFCSIGHAQATLAVRGAPTMEP